jgi:hypothetical protein
MYAKKASTAFNEGDLVAVDSNGFLIPAVAATVAETIIGVSMETVASTDSDYTGTRKVGVDVFDKGDNGDLLLGTVVTGTPAQTQVGEPHDITDAGQIDLTAATTKVVKVQGLHDSTHVLCTLTGVPTSA